MGETRKRLRRKTAGSPLNYADVLVLNMPSWMPYLCLQDNSFIHRTSPSEFTWDSVKCLRFLCKSMHDAWETYFYVKLHIALKWIHRFRTVVPAESLTFLRSDDASHRILTYPARVFGHLKHYAVVTLPWKSLLILQQSADFGASYRHKRYDWRDYEGCYILAIPLRPLLFQDVFHPTGSRIWFNGPRSLSLGDNNFNQFDEATESILPKSLNRLSTEAIAQRLADCWCMNERITQYIFLICHRHNANQVLSMVVLK